MLWVLPVARPVTMWWPRRASRSRVSGADAGARPGAGRNARGRARIQRRCRARRRRGGRNERAGEGMRDPAGSNDGSGAARARRLARSRPVDVGYQLIIATRATAWTRWEGRWRRRPRATGSGRLRSAPTGSRPRAFVSSRWRSTATGPAGWRGVPPREGVTCWSAARRTARSATSFPRPSTCAPGCTSTAGGASWCGTGGCGSPMIPTSASTGRRRAALRSRSPPRALTATPTSSSMRAAPASSACARPTPATARSRSTPWSRSRWRAARRGCCTRGTTSTRARPRARTASGWRG